MTPFRRSFAVLALAAAWVAPGARGEFMLPPIAGELSGQFTAVKLSGAPVLRWTAKLRPADEGGGRRLAEMTVDGDGLHLRGEARLDGAGNGRWSLVEGELEAAKWFAVVAPTLGAALNGVTVSGRLVLSGGGDLQAGQPTGTIQLAWVDGALRHAAQGWSLEGVSLQGEFAVDGARAAVTSVSPCEIRVRTISSTRFGARNFFARAMLNADRTLTLSETRIEIAGGEVTAAACTWPLAPLVMETSLRIKSVGLQDIAAFVPAGLAEARGRVSGEVGVGWSEAQGFKLGEGRLNVTAEEPAMLRLAPSPGFLTKHLSENIELIPGTARWLRARNPAYDDLSAIELGKMNLSVESLSVRLTPEGDERGRTASVMVTARPARATSAIGLVTFEVNVAGPLRQALRLGLNRTFSVEMH